jgi:hypothetical protein
VTDHPNQTRNDVVVINGEVVLRKGDQIFLDGFAGNIFLGRTNPASTAFTGQAFLAEDGTLYLFANIHDGAGAEYNSTPLFGGPSAFIRIVQPEPPANDDCLNFTHIIGQGTFAFDNAGATTDGPSHAACSGAIEKDVWYLWKAPCTADVTVETCGLTSIDTKIAVYATSPYTGEDCPPADDRLLACGDDQCGSQSRATFSAQQNLKYLIRIGVAPGMTGGSGSFSITCVPDRGRVPAPSPTPGARPGGGLQ